MVLVLLAVGRLESLRQAVGPLLLQRLARLLLGVPVRADAVRARRQLGDLVGDAAEHEPRHEDDEPAEREEPVLLAGALLVLGQELHREVAVRPERQQVEVDVVRHEVPEARVLARHVDRDLLVPPRPPALRLEPERDVVAVAGVGPEERAHEEVRHADGHEQPQFDRVALISRAHLVGGEEVDLPDGHDEPAN